MLSIADTKDSLLNYIHYTAMLCENMYVYYTGEYI
jgi:hypothetical protein